MLPGVIYGRGADPLAVELNEHDFSLMLKQHASEHLIADLSVEGAEPFKALVKEIQHHPVYGHMMHVDFLRVSMTDKLRVLVPVELVGEPVGVAQQGGILEHMVREIEVECLPGDMIESVRADVSEMNIGERLAAGDLPLDATKHTLITEPHIAVAAVMASRLQKSAKSEEDGEESAEAAEG